jgi:hypothetical protein
MNPLSHLYWIVVIRLDKDSSSTFQDSLPPICLFTQNPETEQAETQQPLSAALFTCSSEFPTSTPRSTCAPADRVACSLTFCKKMKKYCSILLACITLACENNSEMDAMLEALDYETPDSSYVAGFGNIEGADYTAAQGLFDGNFYCMVIKQPVHGNGNGPSSLRRKNGNVLTDIGGTTYTLPSPGVYTISIVEDVPTLVAITDYSEYPSRVQDFINRKQEAEQAAPSNP